MVNVMTIRTFVGLIGNAISFGLFLSPGPTFYRIIKNKSVEEFKPDPYLLTTINCMVWVLYATPFIHPGSTLVLTTNGVGLVIELIYLCIFLLYAKDNNQKKYIGGLLVLEVAFVALVAGLVIGLESTTKKRTLIMGIICIIFNIGMYCAPLTIAKKVIQTKSVEYMPFWLSAFGTLNGACWLVYGLLKFDINIVIPNGLGFLAGVAQLTLYACYYKKTPKGGADNKQPKSEVQLQGNIV
ncbi:Bidirectional sugar transporter SWEET [Heracleum sosnowskyi]|uniref:Bidirectional sugar transporter SWEET n=1 Tax=Heracleum sosnowskyi TaxID=360622 RepID=A0AAD8JF53_9APIA|nr:Bidirectional sugar transporter SWEET [Heracleum sosnowskyi]